MTESPTPAIVSPCVLICSIDRDTGWCHGCGRTTDEIMDWAGATPEHRADVMAELPARMAQLPQRERKVTRRRAARGESA